MDFFGKMICIKYWFRDEFEQIYKDDLNMLDKINKRFTTIPRYAKKGFWNRTPFLISFKLGDLLRSKLTSKEKEVTAVYRQLEDLSMRHP